MRFGKIWGKSVPGAGEGTARTRDKLGHLRSSKEARVAEGEWKRQRCASDEVQGAGSHR